MENTTKFWDDCHTRYDTGRLKEAIFCFRRGKKSLLTEKVLTYNMWFWNQYDGSGNECSWWLRSTGDSPNRATVVIENGDILNEGWSVGSKYLEVAVRPVILLR